MLLSVGLPVSSTFCMDIVFCGYLKIFNGFDVFFFNITEQNLQGKDIQSLCGMAKNIIVVYVSRELWTFSGTVLYKILHSPGLLYNVLDLLLGNR